MQFSITGDEPYGCNAKLNAVIDFYKAFNTKDINKMSRCWVQNESVILSNPVGGVAQGWCAIESVYRRIFESKADVFVEFYDFTLFPHGQMFAIVGRERGIFKTRNQRVELAIRTSRLYELCGDDWKQFHHHGSIDKPELLKTYQAVVSTIG